MEYQLLMRWEYVVSVDRYITVEVYERQGTDHTGQFLKYYLKVLHDGIEVKRIGIEKFHTAMFTFHKTIDLEVRHHVQNS